ncbi:MAG: hypothetical protein WC484_04905 [Candidatus Omnitrophota bacterium]
MKKFFYLSVTIAVLIFSSWVGDGLAYFERYPPYKFKDGQPAHLNVQPLLSDNGDYKSKDGSVVVHLKEPKLYEVEFFLEVDKTMLVSPDHKREDFPRSVFQADLDNNGLEDFIVFYNSRGSGLAAHQDRVEIYLRKNKSGFEKISYDTFDARIEDFIGPDRRGQYKVIITGFYQGSRHNYVSYNVYEFGDYRLVNADVKVKGFPKFIWYTDKNNDEDTTHLTIKERLHRSREKNRSIFYEKVKQNTGY